MAEPNISSRIAAIRIKTPSEIDEGKIRLAVDQFWSEFRSDKREQERAKAEGVDLDAALSEATTPFSVSQGAAGFDAVTTILISVAGGLTKDALVALWNFAVWPYLRSRFGTAIERQSDVRPS